MPGLTRKQLGNLFRPTGPKVVAIGLSPVGGSAAGLGGSNNLSQFLDLSLPLQGLRFVVKGRCTVGAAAMASVTPEGFLNVLSNITLQGTNSRQKGNVVLYNIDLATLWMIQNLFGERTAQYDISIGGAAATEVADPTMPLPAGYNPTGGAATTYDFRIVVDLPLYPFGAMPGVRPQFLMRNEEWMDSIQLSVQWGTQIGGAVAGILGTGAAGTTIAWAGYGGVGALPTLDIYSLPMIMGLDIKDSVVPGFCSRVAQPINLVLQAAGNQITLFNMQKLPTTRIFTKFGVSVVPNGNPAFSTLTEVNVTAMGITLGGNRQVRNLVDVFAHKNDAVDIYDRGPIQGYNLFDFIGSGNPDSAYPGDKVPSGSTFQLVANVAGVVNAYGIIVQEQVLYTAEGALYSF
jgi:hypothetical protein